MTKITFFPLGNADSTLVQLKDTRSILVDYYNKEDGFDLKDALERYLKDSKKNDFDVVVFTHADNDHVSGAEDFFWLDHAKKYQQDGRPKIKELWVPAVLIVEPGLSGSAAVIQREARHRIKAGQGIRVFGSTDSLETWLKQENASLEVQKAGKTISGFSKANGSVEIFAHSPFSFKMDDDEEERNDNSIVLHLTFFEDGGETRLMMGADAEFGTWGNIVYITEKKKNCVRLEWDIFRISHHCSYSALSEEKGKSKTKPTKEVAKLMSGGGRNAYLISSSEPIPSSDTTQPPHFQAAEYYKSLAEEKGCRDNFLVTTEHPNKKKPQPIVLEISRDGATLKSSATVPAAAIVTAVATSPRFG
jgi:beta-lactamase superfamily II metal-dependent hydrolase